MTHNNNKASLVWFRRDLRSFDHAALYAALKENMSTYCVFVFDTTIIQGLPKHDRRIQFIHESVQELADSLEKMGGSLIVRVGDPCLIIPQLAAQLDISNVYINHDYEPQAIRRDEKIKDTLNTFNCVLKTFKDQVIFEKNEVLTQVNQTYSVFTPYKNAWLKKMLSEGTDFYCKSYPIEQYQQSLTAYKDRSIPSLQELGFEARQNQASPLNGGMASGKQLIEDFLDRMQDYDQTRNFPSIKGPSYLSVHLRFGTVSIRHLVREAIHQTRIAPSMQGSQAWLSELIWRDFYFMILSHHPRVVKKAFKADYDNIQWEKGEKAEADFKAWCDGKTGYPLVDAAMHQLNQTGYMHNRLRMVTACFLIKDLGIDWRWGEAYFALHLNDFDLSANNGGWQWAASSGCDAQPYFRIFNPITQSEKFDAEGKFIRRYLPQLNKLSNKHIHAPWNAPHASLKEAGINLGNEYPHPIVDHDIARKLCLTRYSVVKNNTIIS